MPKLSTGHYCAVIGCHNCWGHLRAWNEGQCEIHNELRKDCPCLLPFRLHKFPRNEDLRRQWITALRRKDYNPGPQAVVCSNHFIGGMKIGKNCIPSQNLGYNKKMTEPIRIERNFNILIGCTGSVAAIKIPTLIAVLKAKFASATATTSTATTITTTNFDIRLITTENALHFFKLYEVPPDVQVFRDQDEWRNWTKIEDPVMHIELRRWATLLLIAPLDANTLAKISGGLCDNLLTCVVRAWEVKNKPLLFCPAMNTFMWEHPITDMQISVLKSWGYTEVPCVSKKLACGDEGPGAMAEVKTIVQKVWEVLKVEKN